MREKARISVVRGQNFIMLQSYRYLRLSWVFDKEGDEPDVGVEGVETLGSHQGGRVVLECQKVIMSC